jgi:hypothetical protein
MSLGESRRSSR